MEKNNCSSNNFRKYRISIMADYRHVNHSQDRYLGTYINKFRELFKDEKLTVPQLHNVLQHFNIKKNENGTYNNSIIQALLKGHRVGWGQVNIQDLKKYYYEHLGTHMGNNNNITDVQNYPKTNPYAIQKTLTWDKNDEGDGLNWKDGNSMETANAILQQRYQWESIQPIKKIRLSESQYSRLFEDVFVSKKNDKNKKATLTYNKNNGGRNKGNLSSLDMLKTDKMDANNADTYEVPLKGGITSYNITSINGTEVMHYFKRHFDKQKTYLKFGQEEYELEMSDPEFMGFMQQFLIKVNYVVSKELKKINAEKETISGLSILAVPSSSNFNVAMAERMQFNQICGYTPHIVNKDFLIKNLSNLQKDEDFINKNQDYYNSQYNQMNPNKTHLDSVNKEYNRFQSLEQVKDKIVYANECAKSLIQKYYSRKETNTDKFYAKLNELYLNYVNAVKDIAESAKYFDTMADTERKPHMKSIAKAIKYTKGPSVEHRTNEIVQFLRSKGYLKGVCDKFDVCLWEPNKFQIKSLGNDVRMALKNYFQPNQDGELVNNELNAIGANVVIVFDDNVSGGATLSDICIQLQELGIKHIIPITFGKMAESWSSGRMVITKPKEFKF